MQGALYKFPFCNYAGRDYDPKLTYALEMTSNIDVRYYSVSFKLRENS